MHNFDKEFNAKLVAGIDEAGRGPLAGPVVCAIAVMPLDEYKIIDGINDSKKLTEKKREMLFDQIKEMAIDYSIVEISHEVIDEINILNATKLGMQKCIENLKVDSDLILVDAVKLETGKRIESIIKGDAKSYNIACASILAKVYRDRLMQEYDLKYPLYNFGKHKGYGTKEHIENLKKYGKCDIHRNSFIKNFMKSDDNEK